MGKRNRARIRNGRLTEADEIFDDVDHLPGRVLEARGNDGSGGRIFGVQIIEHGISKNNRNYPAAVLTAAASMYEGAKAFDHHRTEQELQSSTIAGLVGQYRDVRVNSQGLEANLHLLPSAAHTAEALDASLNAQSNGLPPLIGVSHDVHADYRNTTISGRRVQEATKITRVLSADVVADPAAGGRAIRMVAGGVGDPIEGESMNLKQLLELLRNADAATRASLLTEHALVLTEAGLSTADVEAMLMPPAEAPAPATAAPVAAAAPAEAPVESAPELVSVGAPASESFRADSIFGRQVIRAAVEEAQLPGERAVETITKHLGERFTEAELTSTIDTARNMLEGFELAQMQPRVAGSVVAVGAEAQEKKVKRLDAFFEGNFQEGYHSFHQAYIDFTGRHPYATGMDDFNRTVLRESLGDGGETYNSRQSEAMRMSESGTTSTWALTLGDSITRRMVAEYSRESLQDWRAIVSSMPPINDFRTQRLDRIGGYGTLPTVAQGAPYEPLTTPGEEEATYAVSKKGGTEDLTLEAIANDDVRWIVRIPTRLGLAAARTLRNAVWDVLAANATCTYDSTALFAAGHGNTTAVALGTSGYSQLRALMRRQAGFGDTADLLGLTPKTLIVPPELEELGNEICSSDFAVPATTPGATNVANLAKGTRLLVVDRLTDTNDWFLMADPGEVPTIEVGFYLGREDPELFSQSDPLTGAVFNADKITYKIRHIWGLTTVDHRGFQRGTQ